MLSYQIRRIHQEHLAQKGQLYIDSDGTQFIGTDKGRLELYTNTSNINKISGNITKLKDEISSLIPVDYKVKISSTDTTPDFLIPKLSAGTNITFAILNSGANESIQISSTSVPTTPAGLTTEIQYNLAGVFSSDLGFIRDPATQTFTSFSDNGAFNTSSFAQTPSIFNIDVIDSASNQNHTIFSAAQASFIINDVGNLNNSSILVQPSGFFMSYAGSSIFSYGSWDATGASLIFTGAGNPFAGITADDTNLSIFNQGLTWLWPLTDGLFGQALMTDSAGTLSFGSFPLVVSEAEFLALTITATIAAYTPVKSGMYRIGVWSTVNAISASTLEIILSYNNQNGTSISSNMRTTSGATSVSATGTFFYSDCRLRTDGSTNIGINAKTLGVSINFDIGYSIEYIVEHR